MQELQINLFRQPSQSIYGVLGLLSNSTLISKLVRVLEGVVLDVVVDQETMQMAKIELSAENKNNLMIPRGCTDMSYFPKLQNFSINA